MTNSLKGDGLAIFTIFLGAIIAVVFIGSFSDNIFTQTTTFTNANETVTALAINTSLNLVGRELTGSPSATTWNATNGTDATNQQNNGITLSTKTVNGISTVVLTLNDTATNFVGQTINVSYIYEPDGYISNAGGRSVTSLILIISALAIVVFVIVVLFKFGSINNLVNMGKNNRRRK